MNSHLMKDFFRQLIILLYKTKTSKSSINTESKTTLIYYIVYHVIGKKYQQYSS